MIYEALPLSGDGHPIRLLTIEPATNSSRLNCTLSLATIDNKPDYEALSYCWGEPILTETIHVNGQSFQVTKSLAGALYALQLQHKARTIWADAICMNQNDTAEKNSQVPLMRRIYESCSTTVIWIGDSDKDSKKAFSHIKKASKTYPRALTSVLRRPWFTRTWVIQEVAVAPRAIIQCGKDMVEWEQLVSLASRVPQLGSMVNPSASNDAKHLHPSFYPRILDAARERIKKGETYTLLEALRSFQPFEATNPADKVYGLLGMLSEPHSVDVDYEKSVGEIYRETTLAIIGRLQSLEIFLDCLQSADGPNVPGLPSWVPDWSSTNQPLDHPLLVVSATETFTSSQGTEVDLSILEDGSLQLTGQIIGSIVELAQRFPTIAELREEFWPEGPLPHRRAFDFVGSITALFQTWKDVTCRSKEHCISLSEAYPTGETLFEAFYNTVQKRGPPFSDIDDARKFETWVQSMEFIISVYTWYSRNIANRLPWLLVWIVSGPFFVSVSFLLGYKFVRGKVVIDAPTDGPDASRHNWVPGRTNSGLIGVFPSRGLTAPNALSSEPGDLLAIFKGGARPFVLRRQGERFRLIGDAYIHGIMHGAAFEQDKCVKICLT